jgi:2-methylisocitrate lyase-like PEP mutase family enzyme
VDVPLTVDLESGYGDTAEIVGTTIRLAIEAGAIGCNLEDSFPVNGKLRNMDDHADRLRQARRVADQTTIGFFINARTDVFFQKSPEQHDQSMVQEAIDRARPYAQVGADGLFAPGLTNIALIERLAAESPLPLNVMVVETTPSLRVLAEQGVARISYGPRSYLLLMKALEDAARAVTI